MTLPPRPLVIATLPARSLGDARAQIQIAARSGADVAEIRFDRWPEVERRRMAELFPSPLPLLATLRSTAEGGEGPDSPGTRREWRREVATLSFAYVDIEEGRDPASEPPDASRTGPTVIVSTHLPAGTRAAEVHRRLSGWDPRHGIRKVVLPARLPAVLKEIVPELPPPGVVRFVVHTTGASGPLLRAWSRRLGFAAVFGSLPVAQGVEAAPVEPAQVPVDWLRPYLEAVPPAPLFAVVGSPVGHSLSPALHQAWMRAEGRTGLYVALDVDSERELSESLAPLGEGGFRGLNVTHPLKMAALHLADRVLPGARECGCANLLTFQGPEVEADNTDLLATLRRLEDLRKEGRWSGDELLVLGNGGAARATLAAARSLGVPAAVLARDPARAASVAADFGARVADPSRAGPVPLVVNATTVGRADTPPMAVDLAPWVGPGTYLLDFVYRPENPVLERVAGRRGARYEDGRRLLGYSAAASYERWWGSPLPTEAVLAALEAVA